MPWYEELVNRIDEHKIYCSKVPILVALWMALWH